MYRILVVEDEKDISRILGKYLDKAGYDYDICHDGFSGLEMFSEKEYHLVLLDIMMEGIDGLEILRRIRNVSNVPVLMTTARIAEVDRLKGFDLGADDYIVKPYSMKELMSRIKVFLNRVYGANDFVEIGQLKIDLDRKEGFFENNNLNLSKIEYSILEVLMKNRDHVFTRENLIESAFGFDSEIDNRSIDTYIKRIRRKIEPDPKNPQYLITKYGVGYYFEGAGHAKKKN